MLLQLKKCPYPNNQWHDMNVIDLLKQARNSKVAADYPPMAYPPMAAPKYKPMPPVKRYVPMEPTVSKPITSKPAVKRYAPMEPTVSRPITSKPTVSRKVVPPAPEPVVSSSKPKATPKTPSKRGLYDYTFNELYNAIVYAETGSERNPWIRTKYAPPGGSTAYGKAQLTGGTVRDLIARYPNAFKPLKEYTDKFLKQADLFAAFGKEPNKPGYRKEYDYGGVGLGIPDKKEQLMYDRLAQISLWAKIQDIKKNNAKTWDSLAPDKKLELIIQAWRGKPINEDPQYYRKVINKLKSYINPSI